MSGRARCTWFMLLGLLILGWGANSGAADSPSTGSAPAAPEKNDLSLIPDDSVQVVVVYPRRALSNGALAKLDLGDFPGFAEMQKQGGFSVREIEEVIHFTGPTAEHRNGNSHNSWTEEGTIIRLTKPHAGRALAEKMLNGDKIEEAEAGGKKYFHRAQKQMSDFFNFDTCVFFIDERTFLYSIFSADSIPKMYAPKDARSPLAEALRTLDPAADFGMVMNNADGGLTKMFKGSRALPESLSALPELVTMARVTARIAPEVSATLELTGKDEATAQRIARMVDAGKQVTQAMLPNLHDQMLAGAPEEDKPLAEEFLRLIDKAVAGITSQQNGNRVTARIDGLIKTDELAEKLLIPAIASAKRAQERAMPLNSMYRLGYAISHYENENSRFPARAIFSKEGKPLLSWRVAMLPNMGQKKLYEEFHLDEAWDSPHNKPLIAKMPDLFKSPGGGKHNDEGWTRFVVPTGKDTMFDGDKGITAAEITDGTSNTLLLLRVGDDKAVIWTKPDDMAFDAEHPLAGVGAIDKEGIFAAFADIHVQRIRKDVDEETFRRLVLRNDGQVVEPHGLQPH